MAPPGGVAAKSTGGVIRIIMSSVTIEIVAKAIRFPLLPSFA